MANERRQSGLAEAAFSRLIQFICSSTTYHLANKLGTFTARAIRGSVILGLLWRDWHESESQAKSSVYRWLMKACLLVGPTLTRLSAFIRQTANASRAIGAARRLGHVYLLPAMYESYAYRLGRWLVLELAKEG